MAADAPHERFEQLALGHVLGGLRSQDATEFRAHLVGCRECRLRVAELRDIAADLAATEREERRRAVVATEVARAQDDDADPWWRRLRWLPLVSVIAAVGVMAVLFWNYHLRRVTDEYASVVGRQETVLETIAAGDPLEVRGTGEVEGLAARSGDTVAVALAALPRDSADYLVIWLMDGTEVLRRVPEALPDGTAVSFAIELDGADGVVVTAHDRDDELPDRPSTGVLARVDPRSTGA